MSREKYVERKAFVSLTGKIPETNISITSLGLKPPESLNVTQPTFSSKIIRPSASLSTKT